MTDRILEALESGDRRAILRLYAGGVLALGPLAIIVGMIAGERWAFLATPALACLLIGGYYLFSLVTTLHQAKQSIRRDGALDFTLDLEGIEQVITRVYFEMSDLRNRLPLEPEARVSLDAQLERLRHLQEIESQWMALELDKRSHLKEAARLLLVKAEKILAA
jgi:hypothetical protein